MSSLAVPDLPGFRSNKHKPGAKGHSFVFIDGYAIEKPPVAKVLPTTKPLTTSKALAEGEFARTATATRAASETKKPEWIEHDRFVLKFDAYFKEAVTERADEAFRVRKCTLYHYLEDGTTHISEPKVDDSGIPQGTFIKRHKMPMEEGGFLGLDDLHIGANLSVYGRVFHLCDANASTRMFLEEKRGVRCPPAEGVPEDPYSTMRAARMLRETGADGSVKRGARMNPLKKFQEARLGKFLRRPEARAQFLKYDRHVLRFFCLWDDRSSLFGEVHDYVLHYFLADDTIEILEVLASNSGSDPFPKLLNRDRLPIDFRRGIGEGDRGVEDLDPTVREFVHWRDLHVGGHVSVYGRDISILDADEKTRIYYKEQGAALGPALIVEEEKKEVPKAKPPPHMGFGSEEDSMSSCHSLIAKPPRKDFEKALSKDRLTLRFAAHMDTSRRGDADRSFIVSYYLSDDTVGVFEPAVKNSGIVGGKFLQRAKFRRTDGDFFEPTDFFVGATVTINAHRFVLEDVDEATLNYTEGHPDEYPMSDIELVIGKLVTAISKGLVTVEALFKMADADGSKTITAPELKTFLNETVGATLTGQEVLTLTRHFDVGGDGTINLDEFRAVLDRPVPHRHSPEYVERTTAEGEDAKARSALADVRRAFWNRRGLLAQAFRIVDRDFTGEVKKIAFKEAMAMAATKAHMTLSPEEIRRVTDLIFGKEDTVSITDTLAFIFA